MPAELSIPSCCANAVIPDINLYCLELAKNQLGDSARVEDVFRLATELRQTAKWLFAERAA